MVTVPHSMVGLERMLDYRGVGLQRFHCSSLLLVSSGFETLTSVHTQVGAVNSLPSEPL